MRSVARAMVGLLWCVLGIAPGCSDDAEQPPPCAEQEVAAGHRCIAVGQQCPFPGATCPDTVCRCVEAVGGPSWDCRSATCSCACPCDRIAVVSCESIACRHAPDPCPTDTPQCELICADGGGPDLGVDAPTDDLAPEDLAADSPADGPGADLAADSAADGLSVDLGVDAPTDDLALEDLAADSAADGPGADLAADAAPPDGQPREGGAGG